MNTVEEKQFSTGEDFASLLAESLRNEESFVGRVITGTIIKKTDDDVTIDVGLKSEGRISVKEFGNSPINTGDSIDVYVDRYENKDGLIILSREKARREEAWVELEKQFSTGKRVNGIIFGRVKGGFTVDLLGTVAFLPGSQVDVRPVRDISPLMNHSEPFQILKMDRSRGNIVVSRRSVLEENRAEQRSQLIKNLKEGQILDGIVKNITDYGAFVDLGGVDGLLHVTDIAWKRINHPSESLQIGQNVTVQIIRFNTENQRISLGMKQLEADPWDMVDTKYPIGSKFKGFITNITDYGAFVELESGIEGLVHVSEMSWTKKNIHPGKIVSTSEEVYVSILDVDSNKRRISLGIKQCIPNPWKEFLSSNPSGSTIEGEVKNITEFGLFIGLIDGNIDGMVHFSDLSWDHNGEDVIKDFKKGDIVVAKVLDVDVEKERISLGIKQLTDDPFKEISENIKRGDILNCKISEINENGILVNSKKFNINTFIKKSDIPKEDLISFKIGNNLDTKVTNIDFKSRKIVLSIKDFKKFEEKRSVKNYQSTKTGASLGDILGEALRKKATNR